MESYGEKLREAREEKQLTIDQVARETSITHQYIAALETEDAEVFPGEPYMVGFLKNYADYLGVSSEELLKLYHAKKIQESPVPTELLKRNKPKFLIPLIISIVVLLLLGVGAYLYFVVFKVPEVREEKRKTAVETTKVHQYEFTGKTETKRLYVGDQILVPDSTAKKDSENGGKIILTVMDTKGSLTIETPAGPQIIDLSEERDLDINGDGRQDIILYLSDISSSDGNHGAEVRMLLKDPNAIVLDSLPDLETNLSEIPTEAAKPVASASGRQVVVLEDTRAYPFTVNASFRGSCVFRYRVDRNASVENYYRSGDIVNVTASNAVRLWMSNVNALKIQVIADTSYYDLEVGRAGQVKVEDIKWIRTSEGKYQLVVLELD